MVVLQPSDLKVVGSKLSTNRLKNICAIPALKSFSILAVASGLQSDTKDLCNSIYCKKINQMECLDVPLIITFKEICTKGYEYLT